MARLRISAISYLNTAPLMWDFERGAAVNRFEIHYTVPSRCADELRAGEADIGIIPAFAWAQIPNLVVIPDVAIAAQGPVRSILLVSKVPLEAIRSVAVDNSSRTSVALLDVLFTNFLGGRRPLVQHGPDLEAMLREHDGAMLIGDAALRARTAGRYVYDLAEEWQRATGKAFVFALWAVRQQALREADMDLVQVFQGSRDHGLSESALDELAREWAPKVGLSEPEVVSYLTKNIHYRLDRAALEGLELFLRYALELGLLEQRPQLHFLEEAGLRR